MKPWNQAKDLECCVNFCGKRTSTHRHSKINFRLKKLDWFIDHYMINENHIIIIGINEYEGSDNS